MTTTQQQTAGTVPDFLFEQRLRRRVRALHRRGLCTPLARSLIAGGVMVAEQVAVLESATPEQIEQINRLHARSV